jgi:hypothetical protein
MGMLVARPVVIEALTLELISDVELRCSGTVQTEGAQTEFSRHLEELHEHVVSKRLPVFTIDVRALTFVNSSAIRVFVTGISRAKAASYKLAFKTDRSITWHRLSFSVLQSLAPESVELLEKPGGRSAAAGN